MIGYFRRLAVAGKLDFGDVSCLASSVNSQHTHQPFYLACYRIIHQPKHKIEHNIEQPKATERLRLDTIDYLLVLLLTKVLYSVNSIIKDQTHNT